MTNASSLQPIWFNSAVNLFMEMHENSDNNENYFIEEITNLTTQIQKLALERFDINEQNIKRHAAATWERLSKFPNHQKINELVNSPLFKLVVSTKKTSSKKIDPQWNKKEVISRQLEDYATLYKVNVSYIKNNKAAVKWLCEASETVQTSFERHEMAFTLSQIPVAYYEKTLVQRIYLEREITNKELCNQVLNLLMRNSDGECSWPVEPTATSIYEAYKLQIISPASENFRECIVRNLIVSLQILCRQLPYRGTA